MSKASKLRAKRAAQAQRNCPVATVKPGQLALDQRPTVPQLLGERVKVQPGYKSSAVCANAQGRIVGIIGEQHGSMVVRVCIDRGKSKSPLFLRAALHDLTMQSETGRMIRDAYDRAAKLLRGHDNQLLNPEVLI